MVRLLGGRPARQMNLRAIATRARRLIAKPPSYVARRIWSEIDHTLAGFTQPAFGRGFSTRDLLRRAGAHDAPALWARLVQNSTRIFAHLPTQSDLDALVSGESTRIFAAAGRALRNEIDLLGSGPVALGDTIDWHRDYKTGDRWPVDYFRRVDYINVERRSDVKTAWELSRMQWLLPCAQAWVLTRDERHARHILNVLEQWMAANPYTCGVNWGVTMEPAMRLLTWTWMLRACADSAAFADAGFRERFMRSLFLHGLFTEKYFERSDVNGNHFTADAAALVVVGVLFGEGEDARRWLRTGQRDVEHEIVLQVHPDGVDFEASSAYHRLVAELFLISAVALRAAEQEPSAAFRQRLGAMGEFSAAYCRPD
ncbi:MAG TPA: heparinase II/III family protein, partial [Steroidobacteraceae bacterium]|nr:heparinase II/III family protein [Steroidobacteraceae bacterium]